jgi:ABC-type glycerol-3-phosphate transport system substrate-binding protein
MMKARWSIAALSLATTLVAAGWSAAAPGDAPKPEKVTLAIPNTQ